MRVETSKISDYNKLSSKDFDGAPCNGCQYCTISTKGGISDMVGYYCSYGIQNCFKYANWWHDKNREWEEKLKRQEEHIGEILEEGQNVRENYLAREKGLEKERLIIERERDRIREIKSELRKKKRVLDHSELEYEKFKKFIQSKKAIIESKENKVDGLLLNYRDERERLEKEKNSLKVLREELGSLRKDQEDEDADRVESERKKAASSDEGRETGSEKGESSQEVGASGDGEEPEEASSGEDEKASTRKPKEGSEADPGSQD